MQAGKFDVIVASFAHSPFCHPIHKLEWKLFSLKNIKDGNKDVFSNIWKCLLRRTGTPNSIKKWSPNVPKYYVNFTKTNATVKTVQKLLWWPQQPQIWHQGSWYCWWRQKFLKLQGLRFAASVIWSLKWNEEKKPI